MTHSQTLEFRTEYSEYLLTLEDRIANLRELSNRLPIPEATLMLEKVIVMQDILIELYKIYLGKSLED